MSIKPIYVAQPQLPPLDEFIPYLESIWESKILTNGGIMHQELERELCEYLEVEQLALFNNGTNALLTALQVLGVTGEVITTPYSFVATAHSLIWNGLTPVFVDIDPQNFNIDASKIEAAITSKTTAIMAVHCYGYSCSTEEIQSIADKYDLKVIYDAAHAFGVKDTAGSILRHGDLSVLSFHATKVFHTFEGGAIICKNIEMKKKIDQLKNFGFADETTVIAPGINGKMSEINAAFGLLQLKYIDQALTKRKSIAEKYRQYLKDIPGITLIPAPKDSEENFSYFPILVTDVYPLTRDDLYQKLKDKCVYARRYFYPLISDFPMYKNMPSTVRNNLPVATEIAARVLCLPIYPDLEDPMIEKIVGIIMDVEDLE